MKWHFPLVVDSLALGLFSLPLPTRFSLAAN